MDRNLEIPVILDGAIVMKSQLPELPHQAPVIYEVIRLMRGVPLFIEAHCKRLNTSLHLSGSPHQLDCGRIDEAITALIKARSETDMNVRIDVWAAQEGLRWMLDFAASSYPEPERYQEGVDTDFLQLERTNPNAKIWHAKLKTQVAELCQQHGYYEMILTDQQGHILEGSRSNLFFTKGNTLITAPGSKVLEGITRLVLMELVQENGIALEQREITRSDLEDMDGAFITGTSIHLLPVRSIGAWKRDSFNQPLILRLMAIFEARVAAYLDMHCTVTGVED